MTRQPTTHVLIAGGGVAALEATLALRATASEHVHVELLAAEPEFWYRPLAVAEPFALGTVPHYELGELAAAAGAAFTPGTLASVDAASHVATTAGGTRIPYGVLLIACGATPKPAIPGALTFRGPADTDALQQLLRELEDGQAARVVVTVPPGSTWTLPAYELALLTARHASGRAEVALATPEEYPLGLFGRPASDAIRDLLDARGVVLHAGVYASEFRDAELHLLLGGAIAADRVIALPRLEGQRIDGLPQTVHGFVPVDAHGRVDGIEDVFAAGDITAYPVKQGGLAAQQADAAAEAIAALAGVELEPRPFRPILRGLLLTGGPPRYLRHDVMSKDAAAASREALWWPPAKIVGRHLGPFLAARAGQELDAPSEAADAVAVEVDLGETSNATPSIELLAREPGVDDPRSPVVRDVLGKPPLVVAPEDTLGEVAARMRERDFASALVADYGRLIGILTSRDLLRAFAGRVHPSEGRVREWMTAEPIAVTPDTALEAAALLMTEHHVHHLPVVEGTRPIGMIGYRDAVRAGVRARSRVSIGLGF